MFPFYSSTPSSERAIKAEYNFLREIWSYDGQAIISSKMLNTFGGRCHYEKRAEIPEKQIRNAQTSPLHCCFYYSVFFTPINGTW